MGVFVCLFLFLNWARPGNSCHVQPHQSLCTLWHGPTYYIQRGQCAQEENEIHWWLYRRLALQVFSFTISCSVELNTLSPSTTPLYPHHSTGVQYYNYLSDPQSAWPLLFKYLVGVLGENKEKVFSVFLQESYNAGVKHYEVDDFELAIKYFEQALREYFSEDMECRALCEGPQRFEEYEYLGYKAGLYEAIAGKAFFLFIYFMIREMLCAICKNIPTMQRYIL